MRIKKATYLSLVLLSCFLLSTALGVINSYIIPATSQTASLKPKFISPSEDLGDSNSFNVVKTENENENDYEGAFNIQEFVLPVVFSFSCIELSHPVTCQPGDVLVKESNPIYIAVHNFRI